MATIDLLLKRMLIPFAALFFALSPVLALASVDDWQCLTSDLRGTAANRTAFVSASREASQLFNIPPAMLVAIKRVESGRSLDPMIMGHNRNGTVDRGFYQVNTEVWLPELRRIGAQVVVEDLHGIRQNALIAGWILRRMMDRPNVNGSLEAVGYYHKGGGEDSTSRQIRQTYVDKFVAELRVISGRCRLGGLQTALR